MKYFLLSLILFTYCEIFSQTDLPDDYILLLPEGLDSSEVDLDDLKKAIDRLHNFSEYIYNPVKITSIDSLTYSPRNLTDAGNYSRWGAGSWGRGPFSKYVDRFLVDGKQYTAYNVFYNGLLNKNMKNHYWGTHPIVSYCARTIMAYLNLYNSFNDDVSKSFCEDRIINGTKYLIHQQQPNGGYVQWHWRVNKTSPNIDDNVGLNSINSYATGIAIFALKNIYDYLIQYEDKSPLLIDTIHNTIKNAGNFLVEKDNSRAHKNYISFSIWGLVNAYKVTKNYKFIETALNKYINEIEKFQDSNGAWYKKSAETIDYHDAHSPYMGIIMRALIELFDILPSCSYEEVKERLRKSIINGLNHFLVSDVVHKNFPHTGVRIANDGGIYPYAKQEEYTKFKGRALQLSQAIIYALLSKDLFVDDENRSRLRGFLTAVMNFQITETADSKNVLHVNSDIYFQTFSMYLQLITSKVLE
jgi:hypothetical protein